MTAPATGRRVVGIAGAAQVIQRPGGVELAAGRGPIELMADAARVAAEDAGAPGLLARVGWIGVAGGWFRCLNPAQLVADRIGAPGARGAITAVSGTAPQDLVGLAAERIAGGELDVALVAGGEARWSHQRLKRAGMEPGWVRDPGEGEPERLGAFPDELVEETLALGGPVTAYALFEDALRVAAHHSVDGHRNAIARLWSGFSAVAAENPFAWDRDLHAATQIREPSASNRMICFPYTKAMVANNTVDMASALLLCDLDTARRCGVDPSRMVYPHVVTSAHETWQVVNRAELHRLPALEAAGAAAFEHCRIGPEDLAEVDLYACFPAIVEMSRAALGLQGRQTLTLTGGLGFAGAPVGNAAGQSIAAMVGRLRSGGYGMVHANGGNATKHSVAVYSNEPPERFARVDAQEHVDSQARPELPADWSGRVSIEAATVVYDREGPSHVFAAIRSEEGPRGWATSRDTDLIDQTIRAGLANRPGRRSPGGELLA